MRKDNSPFAIRKAPVEIISAQALTLDDYVKRDIDDTERVSFCTTSNK